MAEITTIKLSEVENFKDLSPEFYKADYMQKSLLIRNQNYRRLSQISYITDGEHGSPCWSSNSGIKYITAEFIKENFIDNGNFKQITVDQDRRNARARLQENDLLIYSVGAYAGLTCVAEPHLFPANIPRSVAIVRLHNLNEFCPEFISVFLNSKFGKFQSLRFRAGNSQPVLALEKIRQFGVPLIDTNFQREIKDLYQQSYKLRKQSQTLYQQATDLLEQELGLDKITFEKPKSYVANFSEVVNNIRADAEFFHPDIKKIVATLKSKDFSYLGSIFNINRGIHFNPNLYSNAGIPYIRIKELSLNEQLDLESIIKLKITNLRPTECVLYGDYVLAVIGATIGKVSLIDERLEGSAFSNNTARLRPKITIEYPFYLELLLRSDAIQFQVQQRMAKTAQEKINDLGLRKIVIPIVPNTIQATINQKIVDSYSAKRESKKLLEQAKNRVELLIEEAAGK